MTEEIEKVEEKVILVGVSEQDGDDAEDSLAELAELVKTAGAEAVDVVIQKRELIHPGTYVGTGRVEEIAQLIADAEERAKTDANAQFEVQTYQQAKQLLELRVQDLRVAEQVAMQSVPMLKTMEFITDIKIKHSILLFLFFGYTLMLF